MVKDVTFSQSLIKCWVLVVDLSPIKITQQSYEYVEEHSVGKTLRQRFADDALGRGEGRLQEVTNLSSRDC